MNFKDILEQAQNGSELAIKQLIELYRPLLIKESIVDGFYDEDLFQELLICLHHCIYNFKIDFYCK